MSAKIGDRKNETTERSAALFAFDDVSMPWRYGVRLEMHQPEKYADNPILARGEPGEVDARRLQCCPVVRDGDRFRMWYIARDDDPDMVHSYDTGRICYAESADGFHWTKPNLGLVEFEGNTKNNICDIEPGAGNMDVLFDPDGPPERRYLMVIEFMGWRHRKGLPTLERPSITRFAASPDGYRWTMLQQEPGVIRQHYEVFCLYRYHDRYHLAGHQGPPMVYLPLQKHGSVWMCGPRVMSVWRSPDVDHWPLEACHAFFKPMQSSSPYRTGWDREENHNGAYVTTYPNVCLGTCGLWHHPITDAPPEKPDYVGDQVSVDLGFIVSNDGVHFREPAPGFVFMGRDQELTWDRDWKDNTANDHLIMLQGPMVNIGDQTVVYYTAFTPTGPHPPLRAGAVRRLSIPRCLSGQRDGAHLYDTRRAQPRPSSLRAGAVRCCRYSPALRRLSEQQDRCQPSLSSLCRIRPALPEWAAGHRCNTDTLSCAHPPLRAGAVRR